MDNINIIIYEEIYNKVSDKMREYLSLKSKNSNFTQKYDLLSEIYQDIENVLKIYHLLDTTLLYYYFEKIENECVDVSTSPSSEESYEKLE
jgi:hypothetical protein